MLHIGSFDDAAPLFGRLHREFMPADGLTFDGRHHEIYLSDPRKTGSRQGRGPSPANPCVGYERSYRRRR